ncbi:MAG: hypothetical protein H7833_04755 [Magnetococcus sp. DMHC-1]
MNMKINKLSSILLMTILALPLTAGSLLAGDRSDSRKSWSGNDSRRHGHGHDGRYSHGHGSAGHSWKHASNWRSGHWKHGHHHGHSGWWWVVGGLWHLYPRAVYPYPDPYYQPQVVVQQVSIPPQVVHTVQTPLPSQVAQDSPTYLSDTGQTCREFQTTITIDGLKYPGRGVACQQADGSWQMAR